MDSLHSHTSERTNNRQIFQFSHLCYQVYLLSAGSCILIGAATRATNGVDIYFNPSVEIRMESVVSLFAIALSYPTAHGYIHAAFMKLHAISTSLDINYLEIPLTISSLLEVPESKSPAVSSLESNFVLIIIISDEENISPRNISTSQILSSTLHGIYCLLRTYNAILVNADSRIVILSPHAISLQQMARRNWDDMYTNLLTFKKVIKSNRKSCVD